MIFLYLWIATQIIIEMLPVSSSAHLQLMEAWLTRTFDWDARQFFRAKNIELTDAYYVLHIPTLCVIVLFLAGHQRTIFWDINSFMRISSGALLASVITVCCYYQIKKFNLSWPLIFGLVITAVSLFYTRFTASDNAHVYNEAGLFAFLGIAQAIALLPGISRLAFTCAAGCWLGLGLFNSFVYSWLIMIPLMAAAAAKAVLTLYRNGTLGQLLNWRICLAMLVSGAVSWYVLKGVLVLIATDTWWVLGWYMAFPIAWWLLLMKKR